jgi:hypothetical protein
MTFTKEDQRKKIRAQLLKEWNEPEPKEVSGTHKQSVSLCKRESPRSRFLKKKGNGPEPGEKISYYLPVLKKAPKVKPDFIPGKYLNDRQH